VAAAIEELFTDNRQETAQLLLGNSKPTCTTAVNCTEGEAILLKATSQL
jgi:hypothetical protein